MRDYLALTKPRITWLILISTGVGYFFGLPLGLWRNSLITALTWPLLHTIVGTGLMASGTAALNQWAERDSDRWMRRTAGRPIPAGRLPAGSALVFGLAISLAGFLELTYGVNLLAGLLGLFTLVSYLCLYTPLKRRSWVSTAVGALPGAMPPLIGFAAAHGRLTEEAWLLAGILFLWQFPHFYAIAWMYRDDYARAGIRMLPVVEADGDSTVRQILLYAAALLLVSLAPAWMGMAGRLYAAGALILGVWMLRAGWRLAVERSNAGARRVLMTSVVYLPALYALMMLDRA